MKNLLWIPFLALYQLATSLSTGYKIGGFTSLNIPPNLRREVSMESCHYVVANFLTAASGTTMLIRSGQWLRFGQDRCTVDIWAPYGQGQYTVDQLRLTMYRFLTEFGWDYTRGGAGYFQDGSGVAIKFARSSFWNGDVGQPVRREDVDTDEAVQPAEPAKTDMLEPILVEYGSRNNEAEEKTGGGWLHPPKDKAKEAPLATPFFESGSEEPLVEITPAFTIRGVNNPFEKRDIHCTTDYGVQAMSCKCSNNVEVMITCSKGGSSWSNWTWERFRKSVSASQALLVTKLNGKSQVPGGYYRTGSTTVMIPYGYHLPTGQQSRVKMTWGDNECCTEALHELWGPSSVYMGWGNGNQAPGTCSCTHRLRTWTHVTSSGIGQEIGFFSG